MTDTAKQKEHTPTPWIVGKTDIHGHGNAIMQAKQSGPYKAFAVCDCGDDPTDEANASYIVKCVNAHEALVGLCEKRFIEVGRLGGNQIESPYRNEWEEYRAVLKAIGCFND